MTGDSNQPRVFSIQHFCIHDGPGVRSVVFLKGCPLHCAWCQNPESRSSRSELAFKPHLCIGCDTCVEICPHTARAAPGLPDAERCRHEFHCSDGCPTGALLRFGEERSVESLVAELQPEFSLYGESGGGVTLSGGEPTLFPTWSRRLAVALSSAGIHVTAESCGVFDPDAPEVREFLAAVDLVLFDLKLFDDAEHRRWCGTGNDRIKTNLVRMIEGRGTPVWPRLPLIPGITDTDANLSGWAGMLRELGIPGLTLVPYHTLGESKRPWLGLEGGPDIPALTDGRLSEVKTLVEARGVRTYEPGEEDWDQVVGS